MGAGEAKLEVQETMKNKVKEARVKAVVQEASVQVEKVRVQAALKKAWVMEEVKEGSQVKGAKVGLANAVRVKEVRGVGKAVPVEEVRVKTEVKEVRGQVRMAIVTVVIAGAVTKKVKV